MGTPVLVSDLGNGGSLVKEGITGMKFNQRSPQSIADTVRRFLSDRETPWNDNALREYQRTMTPENNYRRLMEIYQHAMGEGSGT